MLRLLQYHIDARLLFWEDSSALQVISETHCEVQHRRGTSERKVAMDLPMS